MTFDSDSSWAPPLPVFCSHFQAQSEAVRDAEMLWAQPPPSQDGLRRGARGAAFDTWQEGRGAAALAWEQRLARASIAHWQSLVQGRWADRQRRRTRVQQAFLAWRVALGQRWEAQQQAEKRVQARAQVALCWTLWVCEFRLHRLSRAHAARKLSTRWVPTDPGQPPTLCFSAWALNLLLAGMEVGGARAQG